MSRMKLFTQSFLRTFDFQVEWPASPAARFALALVASCLPLFLVIAAVNPAMAQDSRLNGFADATSLAVNAENTVIETDASIYTIKTIELHGTSMTNADLAALLDPKASPSLADRFVKLSASEVFIPELIVTTKSTPGQKVTYQNIRLKDVRQGKAASADIESSQFSVTNDKSDKIEGNYGHIHAQGVDLALASRIMSETRKDETEPLKTLYESFSIEGFNLAFSGKDPLSMQIAQITGRNVKTRAFATHPSDYLTASGDQTQLAALIKDYLTSIEIEEMEASNMELISKTDGKPFHMSLAKMSISKFGNTQIGDIDFGSLAMKVEGTAIKVEDIDFKAIDFQKLREAPSKEAPSKEALSKGTVQDAGPDVDDTLQTAVLVPVIAQFVMNKIDVGFSDEKNTLAQTKPAFSINRFEIDGETPIEPKPTHVTAILDHFVLNADFINDSYLKPFIEMGYPKLDLSSKIEMAWDADKEELTVKSVSVSGVDMGAVKVSGLIDNLSKDFFSGDTTAMQAAAFGALIKKIEIRIDNAGLFEKATAMQAKEQNKSIDEIKQSYVTTAALGIPAMLNNKPAAKIVGAAIAKFVANPKSLDLVATSADGLGASDFALMKDPSMLLDTLDIKASANE